MLHRLFENGNKPGTQRQNLRRTGKLRCNSVLLAAVATLLLSAQQGMGQLPALSLESPIVPGGGPAIAPTPTPAPMSAVAAPVYSGAIQEAAPGVPIQGQYPVGSAFSGQTIQDPQVAQTSFVGCTSCGSVGCSGCDDYGPGYAAPAGMGMWFRADYLSWFESGMDVKPLVTSNPANSGDALPADPRTLLVLGGDGTNIEFGGRDYDDNPLSGWRFEVGAWLDAGATFGIMGRYFSIEDQSFSFAANSVFSEGFNDFNFVGIPFFNPDGDVEDALDIAVLNEREGAITVDITSQLSSWEILFRRLAETGCNYRLDWVYGYRNLRLEESLDLRARTEVTDAIAGTLGTDIRLTDSFDVENQFHGIDLGITGHSREGCWSLDFLAKVALGVMNQEVIVDGEQLIAIPDLDLERNVGGLFSQESNIGSNDNDQFGVIPEFDINLGYAITPNLDLTVGYTFIYLHGIVRAGSVIDRTVDPGLALDLDDPINSNRPQLDFDSVSYHIHGLNLGVTARF